MILLVGGEKGGTGKTTLATNLAAMRAGVGRDVLLVDTDPQGSASFWAALRAEDKSLARVGCVQKFGRGLQAEIRDLATRYEDVIIDAGGRDSVELRASLCVADVALLPVQASQFDLWTVEQLARLVEQARGFNESLDALCVVSRASTHSCNSDAKDAADLISDYLALRLASATIRDRLAFKRAAGDGKSVAEYVADPDDKSFFEMRKLFAEVFRQTNVI